MIKKSQLYLFLILTLLFTCERDDICATSTATTPRLRLEFYDITNDDELKSVNRLTAFGEGLDESTRSIVSNSNSSALSLPLKFELEGVETVTRYILRKDSNLDLDNDPLTNSNEDILEIRYVPEYVFVSRACGYKAVFNDLSISVIDDGDNWALTTSILTTTIENEAAVHVYIFH